MSIDRSASLGRSRGSIYSSRYYEPVPCDRSSTYSWTGPGSFSGAVAKSLTAASVLSDATSMYMDTHTEPLARSVDDTPPQSPSLASSGAQDKVNRIISTIGNLNPNPTIPTSVWCLFGVSFLAQCALATTNFVGFFICKANGWLEGPGGKKEGFYGISFAISTLVPVFMGPALGKLTLKVSIKYILIVSMFVSTAGVFMMTFTASKIGYLFGVFLRAAPAIRSLRSTYITMVTNAAIRTKALSYLTLFTEAAWLLGVLVARFWGEVAPEPILVEGYYLSRLDLSMLTSNVLFIVAAVALAVFFRDESLRAGWQRPKDGKASPQWTKSLDVIAPDGTVHKWNLEKYTWWMTLYFGVLCFMHQIGNGINYVAYLPAMDHVVTASSGAKANVEETIATYTIIADVLRLPAPLLVAFLAPFLDDRYLMVLGNLFALLGIATFAGPPCTSVWQPVLGSVLVACSKSFFYSAVPSLFSKVLGPRATHTRMATVASVTALGTSIGSFIGGSAVGKYYTEYPFMWISMVPFALALLFLINPVFFKMINPEYYVTLQISEAFRLDQLRWLDPHTHTHMTPKLPDANTMLIPKVVTTYDGDSDGEHGQ